MIRSFRRSSVSGGKANRITLPSFDGVRPRSEDMMAFSIADTAFLSKGWMTRRRGSGTENEASWFRGTCVP